MSLDMERPAPGLDAGQPPSSPHNKTEGQWQVFPPGLLGEVASFFYSAAPRQAEQMALSSSIGFLAGICGNSYNVSGKGLNLFILQLAETGGGKDIVHSGSAQLVGSIHDYKTGKPFPHSAPGELVSAAGLVRWLEDHSCFNAIIGEFPKQLRELANPKNALQYAIGRQLLKLYNLSGVHDTYQPLAYSDRNKRTGVIHSPALTIYGEGTPEEFYKILTPDLICDGLLPRFMVFDHKGKRPYLNKGHDKIKPRADLIEKLKDLVGYCAGLRKRHAAHNVELSRDAEDLFDRYDVETTDFINYAKTEVNRRLLNRAHQNALRLAALMAVGENYLNPIVSLDASMWAIDLITAQTNNLIAKFEHGEVGDEAGNQSRQLELVKWAIRDFFQNYEKLGGFYPGPLTYKFWERGVIPLTHIKQRLCGYAAFKHDKRGANDAIRLIVESLAKETDALREVSPQQMLTDFNCKPKSYFVANRYYFGIP